MMHFFGAGVPFEMFSLYIFPVTVRGGGNILYRRNISQSVLLATPVAKTQQTEWNSL